MAWLLYHVPPVLQGKGLKQMGPEYSASKNTAKYLPCFKTVFFLYPMDAIFDLGTKSTVCQTL